MVLPFESHVWNAKENDAIYTRISGDGLATASFSPTGDTARDYIAASGMLGVEPHPQIIGCLQPYTQKTSSSPETVPRTGEAVSRKTEKERDDQKTLQVERRKDDMLPTDDMTAAQRRRAMRRQKSMRRGHDKTALPSQEKPTTSLPSTASEVHVPATETSTSGTTVPDSQPTEASAASKDELWHSSGRTRDVGVITVRGMVLDTGSVAALSACLANAPLLAEIDLWHVALSEKSIRILAAAIPNCPTLKTLSIGSNIVEDEHAVVDAPATPMGPTAASLTGDGITMPTPPRQTPHRPDSPANSAARSVLSIGRQSPLRMAQGNTMTTPPAASSQKAFFASKPPLPTAASNQNAKPASMKTHTDLPFHLLLRGTVVATPQALSPITTRPGSAKSSQHALSSTPDIDRHSPAEMPNTTSMTGVVPLQLKPCPLETFRLRCTNLNDAQVAQIAAALIGADSDSGCFEGPCPCPNLTTLTLFGNSITDKGAQSLARALRTNRTLTSLSLGSTSVSDLGAAAIAAVCTRFPLTSQEASKYRRVRNHPSAQFLNYVGLSPAAELAASAAAIAAMNENTANLQALDTPPGSGKRTGADKPGQKTGRRAAQPDTSDTPITSARRRGAQAQAQPTITEATFGSPALNGDEEHDMLVKELGHIKVILNPKAGLIDPEDENIINYAVRQVVVEKEREGISSPHRHKAGQSPRVNVDEGRRGGRSGAGQKGVTVEREKEKNDYTNSASIIVPLPPSFRSFDRIDGDYTYKELLEMKCVPDGQYEYVAGIKTPKLWSIGNCVLKSLDLSHTSIGARALSTLKYCVSESHMLKALNIDGVDAPEDVITSLNNLVSPPPEKVEVEEEPEAQEEAAATTAPEVPKKPTPRTSPPKERREKEDNLPETPQKHSRRTGGAAAHALGRQNTSDKISPRSTLLKRRDSGSPRKTAKHGVGAWE